jgi:hypothetical protein
MRSETSLCRRWVRPSISLVSRLLTQQLSRHLHKRRTGLPGRHTSMLPSALLTEPALTWLAAMPPARHGKGMPTLLSARVTNRSHVLATTNLPLQSSWLQVSPMCGGQSSWHACQNTTPQTFCYCLLHMSRATGRSLETSACAPNNCLYTIFAVQTPCRCQS